MKRAYLLIAAAICVMGLYAVAKDLMPPSDIMFRGIGVLIGLAIVFSGMFHLLNYQYAPIARAVSGAAFGASVALLAGFVWVSWGNWGWSAVLLVGLLAAAAVFSVTPAVRRPNQPGRAGAV